MASDARAFEDAIRAKPEDPTVRLVYADWLEEHTHLDRYRPRRFRQVAWVLRLVARLQTADREGALSGPKYLEYFPYAPCLMVIPHKVNAGRATRKDGWEAYYVLPWRSGRVSPVFERKWQAQGWVVDRVRVTGWEESPLHPGARFYAVPTHPRPTPPERAASTGYPPGWEEFEARRAEDQREHEE